MIWTGQNETMKASSCCLVGIESLLQMVSFLACIIGILATRDGFSYFRSRVGWINIWGGGGGEGGGGGGGGGAAACFDRGLVATSRKAKENV
jgi:hypothetical protein